MSNYDVNSVLQFGRLKEFGEQIAPKINASIKSAKIDGNAIKLYTSTDMSGTAAFSLDFPSELVLDSLKTKFIAKFAFSAETYPGATDPSYENKPVLVIAIKETKADGSVVTTYSFLNMETLVDTYTIALGNSAKILTIDANNVITVHVSDTSGNHLTVNDDGLMVNVSDKVDKVTNATAGDIALLTSDGGISDSGYSFATSADVTELIGELFN